MIIDAHYHIFPPFGSASGGDDPRLNMKLFQYHIRDARRFWRKADGKPVEQPLLEFEGDDMADMPDVNFRMTDFGQAEFTIGGVGYCMQLYPPNLKNNEAPPERMVAEMDVVAVDMGVLQHDHIYGALNEYYAEAIRKYPGRFISLAQVREWEADQPAQIERLEQAVLEYGNKGLYFSVEPFALSNYADHLDDAKFEPLWDKVRELRIPVWWYIHSRRRNRLAGIMEHVAELDRWAVRHPDIQGTLTHGLDIFNRSIRSGPDQYTIPDEFMALLKRPNMSVEVLFHATSRWPAYPFEGAQRMIRRLCDEIGVEKLMWGTDMPYCSGYWCTYQQALDYVRLSQFLSEKEKALILGDNAARMFDVQQ